MIGGEVNRLNEVLRYLLGPLGRRAGQSATVTQAVTADQARDALCWLADRAHKSLGAGYRGVDVATRWDAAPPPGRAALEAAAGPVLLAADQRPAEIAALTLLALLDGVTLPDELGELPPVERARIRAAALQLAAAVADPADRRPDASEQPRPIRLRSSNVVRADRLPGLLAAFNRPPTPEPPTPGRTP